MIENAMGDSPLVANLDSLLKTGPSSRSAKAVPWAVQTLTKAGVDSVKTEPFEVRSSRGRGPTSAANVVGEIRGWEKPDEFVVLGAATYAPGEGGASITKTKDNAAAEAVMVDAARVIHSSGSLPRRSVRFVLFDQQARAFPGSRVYLQQHRAELDRTVAVIFLDAGRGALTGYSLGGRKDALPAVRDALEPLKPLGVQEFSLGASIDSSGFDFLLEGIPALSPIRASAQNLPNDKAGSGIDEDGADIRELKRESAIAAIAAYALADRPERTASRQSRAEIEQLLEETGLAEQMKKDGSWREWQSGQRGRR